MKMPSFLHRRRFQFRRVFWITFGTYLFFQFIGLVFMYMTPSMNTAFNWEKVYSWQSLLDQLLSLVFYVLFYFITLNMFYRLFVGKHKTERFIRPVIIGLVMLGLYFVFSTYLLRLSKFEMRFNNTDLKPEMTFQIFLFAYLVSSVFTIGFSIVIAYLIYLRDEKKQRKILEEQKMQLEVEKSQANLNFLKAQINPHFLHNTLNFLYAKSLPYSTELSEGILTLSEIMRYALGPASKEGKVMLKDEIEHVRNVIKINQLRFSNNLNVQFDVTGVVNGATIIPFILITIVENAFKHGDLKSAEHPISIRLAIEDKDLHFCCRNRKKSGTKEISTGIGLDNIKKQLDLTYGRKYSLQVRDEAEFYSTDLTIHAV